MAAVVNVVRLRAFLRWFLIMPTAATVGFFAAAVPWDNLAVSNRVGLWMCSLMLLWVGLSNCRTWVYFAAPMAFGAVSVVLLGPY